MPLFSICDDKVSVCEVIKGARESTDCWMLGKVLLDSSTPDLTTKRSAEVARELASRVLSDDEEIPLHKVSNYGAYKYCLAGGKLH